MLSVRDIEIVHLQFKILNSRGFSVTKDVNKRFTVTSNEKFEIWFKTVFFASSSVSFGYKYISIGDHDTERREKIYFSWSYYNLLFMPHNNRKWTTNNIGNVEKRSGEETGYRSLWAVI